MADGHFGAILHRFRYLFEQERTADTSDGQLLRAFASDHDQSAFAALMQRHGPLVLGLCRRILQDDHEAEDVYQAAFLVLARKARSLTQYGSLANWLYTVTYRLALRARSQQARRHARERQVDAMPEMAGSHEPGWSELRPILDAELQRLPAHYREAVLLCYLEGKTNDEAARELGWPIGTLKVRLARARDLLRQRLDRRGLAVPATLLTASFAAQACAAVPATLQETTLNSATLFAAGQTAAIASGSLRSVVLAQGALKAMFLSKLQFVIALLAIVGLAGIGTGTLLSQGADDEPPAPAAPEVVAFAAAPADRAEADAAKAEKTPRITKRLLEVNDFDGIAPNTPLGEALETISKRFQVTFKIDSQAFESIGVQKPEEQPVTLPQMPKVRLQTVLDSLLKQVKGDVYVGSFLLRGDHIEITTSYHQLGEMAAAMPDHPLLRKHAEDNALMPIELFPDNYRRLTPVVHPDIENQPVGEAIRQLAGSANIDIVFDPKIADKTKAPVTLILNNVLFDTGLDLLVEMGNLDYVWHDRVVFVTTKEIAQARRDKRKAEEAERAKILQENKDLKLNPLPGPGQPNTDGTLNASFTDTPLVDALDDVSRQTGLNIVVDARMKEKTKSAVSARFNGVAPPTAVRLLADMAGLRAVSVDKVLYVTSVENAKALQEEKKTP